MDQEAVMERFVKNVVKTVKPKAILLFGSRARGDAHKESDFDFIVIARSMERLDRGKRYALLRPLAGYGLGVGVDILSFTPDEFSKAIPRSFILRDALQHAQILYGNVALPALAGQKAA